MGYGGAGMRQIAARVAVDPALVMRYFGSKAGLYEAALIAAVQDFPRIALDHAHFGVRVTEQLAATMLQAPALSMIVLSAGDPLACEIGRKVMREHAIGRLAEWLGPPQAEARAVRMTMLMTGFLFYSRKMPLVDPSEAGAADTARWLAGALQAIIDDTTTPMTPSVLPLPVD